MSFNARFTLLAGLRLACPLLAVDTGVPPVPPSWVAKETLSVVAQGQVKSETVTHYFDLAFNRTRVEDDQGGLTVTMYYPVYKQMDVDPKTMQCQKYCSLCDQGICDDLDPLIDVNATDAGPLFLGGKQYQIAQMREKIFGVLTLELDTVYVDMTNASMPLPASEQQVVSPPFFPPEMTMYADTEWQDFQPKTFDKAEAKFAVQGVDTCKKASIMECNGLAKQLRLVRDKAWHSYARTLAPSTSLAEEVQV